MSGDEHVTQLELLSYYLAGHGYSSYQSITVLNRNITVPNCPNCYGTGTTLHRGEGHFLAIPNPDSELSTSCARTYPI